MTDVKDEKTRLKSLHELEILDTEKEECYDDITFLAASICNAPISLISFVDNDRQWFKSKIGLEVNQTPREVAFCDHAIKQDNLFLVENPLLDERFKNNPLVTGGIKIRFYAGVPLKAKNGCNLGTLCIIDTQPKTLSDDQKQALLRLARQSEHLLSLRLESKLLHKTQEELKTSEEWAHIFFNDSTDMMGIVRVDQERRWPLEAVNPAFCQKVNIDAQQIIGRPVEKIISTSLIPVTFENFLRVIAQKRSVKFESTSHLNGVEAHYESVISPKLNSDGEVSHFLIMARDITERKRNEALIFQQNLTIAKSSKFSELGELAGNMAHEINNPLTVIMSRSSKLKNQILANEYSQPAFLKSITQINETAERIAKIIKGLKNISRNADLDPMNQISLASIIEDAQFLCEERLRTSDIKFSIEYPENLSLELEARGPQLTQVLINLINNSVHAISSLDEKWIKMNISESKDKEYIIIRTSDSGFGISSDIQMKIMEPFFTTKEFGKGTGLGLSISRGIIESHQGKFYYDPSCKNTTFTIEIPRKQKKDIKHSA